MATQWTKQDQQQALQLGWGIWQHELRGLEIQRWGEDPDCRFSSDEQAYLWVCRAARAGNELATKAMAAVILKELPATDLEQDYFVQMKIRPAQSKQLPDPAEIATWIAMSLRNKPDDDYFVNHDSIMVWNSYTNLLKDLGSPTTPDRPSDNSNSVPLIAGLQTPESQKHFQELRDARHHADYLCYQFLQEEVKPLLEALDDFARADEPDTIAWFNLLADVREKNLRDRVQTLLDDRETINDEMNKLVAGRE